MRADELLPDSKNDGEFNGVTVRKGTVGAFLVNARTWLDAATGPDQRGAAERDIVEALPALGALGLFDILEVRDKELDALITRFHTEATR